MNKFQLPFVEMMVTQFCNLSCVGCSNYADLKHTGYVRWEDGRREIESWMKRMDINEFGIMGGEPLINPELKQWIRGLRELLPTSPIRFSTNGELLDRNLDVVETAHEVGNFVFKITVHQHSERVEAVIAKIFDMYKWEPVREYGVNRYRTTNGLRFQINRPQTFIKTYRNDYANMQPFDSNPADSFDICIQQTCPLMLNGRLYKCSTLGGLEDTLKRFKITDPAWAPYLGQYITPDSSDVEIQTFLNNYGRPHAVCRMCPTAKDTESVVLHYNRVLTK
jgi:organic radical activating enzyme